MRLCLAEIRDFVEWNPKSKSFLKTGYGYKAYEMFFQTMIGNSKNWTLMTTVSNPECLQRTQLNNTDIVVATLHFPLNPNLTNVR